MISLFRPAVESIPNLAVHTATFTTNEEGGVTVTVHLKAAVGKEDVPVRYTYALHVKGHPELAPEGIVTNTEEEVVSIKLPDAPTKGALSISIKPSRGNGGGADLQIPVEAKSAPNVNNSDTDTTKQ